MIRAILDAFKAAFFGPAELNNNVKRNIVKLRAEGNINLHSGNYKTQDDISELVDNAISAKF